MLQKYDNLKSSLLLAVAAAGGVALSMTASAGEAVCSLENGYAQDLASYISEASACIETAESFDIAFADGLVAEINNERIANGLAPLRRRATLDMAAKAHALDMSERSYAAQADLEGRDHLHRIRAFDRTMLVGASGSNVTVGSSIDRAIDIHKKIKRDTLNVDNMLHASFTDVGVGVIEKAGKYYVVQVFAAAEGDLETAIPVRAKGAQPLHASLLDRDRQVVAWGLSDATSGEMLAKSNMPRVRFSNIRGADAAHLDILVAERDHTYILKGPLVSGR